MLLNNSLFISYRTVAVPKINLKEFAFDELLHDSFVLEIDEFLKNKIVFSFFEVDFGPRSAKQRIHASHIDR